MSVPVDDLPIAPVSEQKAPGPTGTAAVVFGAAAGAVVTTVMGGTAAVVRGEADVGGPGAAGRAVVEVDGNVVDVAGGNC